MNQYDIISYVYKSYHIISYEIISYVYKSYHIISYHMYTINIVTIIRNEIFINLLLYGNLHSNH